MNIGPNYISAQEWQTLFDKKNEIASPLLNKLPTEPEQKNRVTRTLNSIQPKRHLGFPATKIRRQDALF